MRVTLNRKADKPVALVSAGFELEFGVFVFVHVEEGKPEKTEKNPLSGDENQKQT